MNILEYLQSEVDRIAKVRWDDACAPKFIVSLLYGESQKILLTCVHGDARSVVLFPKKDIYSYDGLESEMSYLYNSTL